VVVLISGFLMITKGFGFFLPVHGQKLVLVPLYLIKQNIVVALVSSLSLSLSLSCCLSHFVGNEMWGVDRNT
jgi:hypothetical protein